MTFSIVAMDPQSGRFGVATATAGPAVGALVPHTRCARGAVATQAMTNPYLAIDALTRLGDEPAEAALDFALGRDADADRRQVIVVDKAGRTAAWTGKSCTGFAGHIAHDSVAVAGNMLAGEAVIETMLAEYRDTLSSGFAQALLRALQAGAKAGGDSRGTGSAALRIQGDQSFADIDLRVDLSSDPLRALGDLLTVTTEGSYSTFFAGVPRRQGPVS